MPNLEYMMYTCMCVYCICILLLLPLLLLLLLLFLLLFLMNMISLYNTHTHTGSTSCCGSCTADLPAEAFPVTRNTGNCRNVGSLRDAPRLHDLHFVQSLFIEKSWRNLRWTWSTPLFLTWLVVWNMTLIFPSSMGCHPSHWRTQYVSRWLLHHQAVTIWKRIAGEICLGQIKNRVSVARLSPRTCGLSARSKKGGFSRGAAAGCQHGAFGFGIPRKI